jgi:hypothetical protein
MIMIIPRVGRNPQWKARINDIHGDCHLAPGQNSNICIRKYIWEALEPCRSRPRRDPAARARARSHFGAEGPAAAACWWALSTECHSLPAFQVLAFSLRLCYSISSSVLCPYIFPSLLLTLLYSISTTSSSCHPPSLLRVYETWHISYNRNYLF